MVAYKSPALSFQSIDFPGEGEAIKWSSGGKEKVGFQSIDFPGEGEVSKKKAMTFSMSLSFQSIDFPGEGEERTI